MTCSLALRRWTDVLTAILRTKASQCYCERLCRILHCSKAQMWDMAHMLARFNLIEFVPFKNVRRLVLTETGTALAKGLLPVKIGIKKLTRQK